MREPNFEPLSRELVDAGITPKFAYRLRRELEDHYRDLENEALARESSAEAAAAEARRRLGAESTIAREFLIRPELRSWVYRSRWVVACLRGVCRVYLCGHALARLLAAWRPAIARFATAGVTAVLALAAMLLALDASIEVEPADGLDARPLTSAETRFAEPRERVARLAMPAAEAPREPPARVDVTAPALRRAAAREAELYDVALRVRPMVALDVELQPGAFPTMKLVDGDLLPIVKVAPQFPVYAAQRGIEGYVLIEYTVTRTGAVSDVVVVESSSELFEKPALEAVSKFKYKPRVVDGRAVPVRGVRARMRFVIEA